MKKMYIIIPLLFLMILSSCTKEKTGKSGIEEQKEVGTQVNKDAINIAVLAAKTGDASEEQKLHFIGAKLAVDELNNNGGLLGKKIEIVEIDTQSTAIGSAAAAKEAVRLGVNAVIGLPWSSHSLAAAPILQDAKIPMISPSATNPDVTLVGDYIFRACFTDPFQGTVMANFAIKDLKAENAVMLTNTSRAYSIGLASFFQIQFLELGGEVLSEEEYLGDETDFSQIITKAVALEPDVIFIPGGFRDIGYLIKQIRQKGFDKPIIGGDGISPQVYSYAGEYADKAYGVFHWHEKISNEKNRHFMEIFRKSYKDVEPSWEALAYDCMMVLAQSIKDANSSDSIKIREALGEIRDFPTTTGLLTFDKNGDPIKSAVIVQLQDEKMVFIKTIEP